VEHHDVQRHPRAQRDEGDFVTDGAARQCFDTVLVGRRGQVALVQLNRPN
jgi:hypothetical protein